MQMQSVDAPASPQQTTPDAPSMKALLHQGLQALEDQRRQRFRAAKGLPPDAPEPPRTGLYVSEIGAVIGEAACWRKLFYAGHNVPRDPLTMEQLLTFRIGDVIEQLYIDLLTTTGVVEKIQVPVPFAGYPVSGRLDVLIRRTDRKVIELKSTTVKIWRYLPKQEHLDQTLLYIHGLRTLTAYADLSHGLLVYIAKDGQKGHETVREIPVLYDATRAEEILSSYEYAWDAARADTEPPRPAGYKPSEHPCSYCAWASTCWSAPNA